MSDRNFDQPMLEGFKPWMDLDTIDRLGAIEQDPRAGFLPTTHQEKNEAFSLLDYVNNPRYPGGVHDKLAEIFQQQKSNASEQGKRNGAQVGSLAVQSIVYTYGDYFMHAKRDLADLQSLQPVIKETPNPKLSLGEAIEDTGQAGLEPASLVRYLDLSALRRGQANPPFDPLRTVQRRFDRSEYAKNKVVEDVYTAETQDEQYYDYIVRQLGQVTIGALRDQMPKAIQDQYNRARFWWRVIGSRPYEYKTQFALVRAMIQSSGK